MDIEEAVVDANELARACIGAGCLSDFEAKVTGDVVTVFAVARLPWEVYVDLLNRSVVHAPDDLSGLA